MQHGLITWGTSAQQAYQSTIELVDRAERFIQKRSTVLVSAARTTPLEVALQRSRQVAPLLRGVFCRSLRRQHAVFERTVVLPIVNNESLQFVDAAQARSLAVGAVLTPDHLIRTKAYPLFIAEPDYDDPAKLVVQIEAALKEYSDQYNAYCDRFTTGLDKALQRFDDAPRMVLLGGCGALCLGPDLASATIVRDITAATIGVKSDIAKMGGIYQGLSDDHLFAMEYRRYQHAKLPAASRQSLTGTIALVTGAAGAIGNGICRKLLEQGALVAATDLAGSALDAMVAAFEREFANRIIGVPLDVTDAASIGAGFDRVIAAWGGIDLLIINAGIAHVAALAELTLDAFRKLEKVNVEGTLLLLHEAAAHFKNQGCGGDIVLVSTKNVFAPGAGFGAYSATKAAAHQLARIASLEFAGLDVRVNMVSPDAVFNAGAVKSGLWATVCPDRMRARGLDEKGLHEYYRGRNLLKAEVTAEHVANGVLFFATRQTPTTGATIPIDGGLPDATPR
ncbi:MAG: SDR family NAD(P)-dependent oxidoreductase [Chitinivibrionales bacterium]|nr:SDR family NAD(P)-dependent oxidoreductase [Chitinivibrionales bacterium]